MQGAPVRIGSERGRLWRRGHRVPGPRTSSHRVSSRLLLPRWQLPGRAVPAKPQSCDPVPLRPFLQVVPLLEGSDSDQRASNCLASIALRNDVLKSVGRSCGQQRLEGHASQLCGAAQCSYRRPWRTTNVPGTGYRDIILASKRLAQCELGRIVERQAMRQAPALAATLQDFFEASVLREILRQHGRDHVAM